MLKFREVSFFNRKLPVLKTIGSFCRGNANFVAPSTHWEFSGKLIFQFFIDQIWLISELPDHSAAISEKYSNRIRTFTGSSGNAL